MISATSLSFFFFNKGTHHIRNQQSMGGVLSPGNLLHVGADLILASMVLAGIKMVTGYELSADSVAHTDGVRAFVRRYLHLGEWLFQVACNKAVNSKSFRRVDWKEFTQSFSSNFLGSTKRMMDDLQKSFESAAGNGDPKVTELN